MTQTSGVPVCTGKGMAAETARQERPLAQGVRFLGSERIKVVLDSVPVPECLRGSDSKSPQNIPRRYIRLFAARQVGDR